MLAEMEWLCRKFRESKSHLPMGMWTGERCWVVDGALLWMGVEKHQHSHPPLLDLISCLLSTWPCEVSTLNDRQEPSILKKSLSPTVDQSIHVPWTCHSFEFGFYVTVTVRPVTSVSQLCSEPDPNDCLWVYPCWIGSLLCLCPGYFNGTRIFSIFK